MLDKDQLFNIWIMLRVLVSPRPPWNLSQEKVQRLPNVNPCVFVYLSPSTIEYSPEQQALGKNSE